jgi:hypothetical protein
MRLIRLYAAVALLRGAGIVAGVIAGPGPHDDEPRPDMLPAERILLASLTGLAICFLWVWINGRAWR